MRVIPTTYGGVRFRSRLEARWAVFFDRVRIGWEFEPEAYELDDGTRYAPDFRLSGVRFWWSRGPIYAEVKPAEGDFERTSFVKAIKFSHAAEGNVVLLCPGPPRRRLYTLAVGVAAKDLRDGRPIIKTEFHERRLREIAECVTAAQVAAAVKAAAGRRFWEPRAP